MEKRRNPATRHSVKRKGNKVPLNFLTTCQPTGPRKKRFKIAKESIAFDLKHNALSNPKNAPLDTAGMWNEGGFGPSDETEVGLGLETETTHTKRKQKMAEKWKEIRSDALRVVVGGYSLREGAKCCICKNGANARCQQCGPSLLCSECCVKIHTELHHHHYPEIWKVHICIWHTCSSS